MTDDVKFVKMIYRPTYDRLAVTATTLFPPADPNAVIEVHPSAVEEHRRLGWIIPPIIPRRRATDR